MTLFSYDSDQEFNQGLITKGASDQPSYRVDFADGLVSSATVITTASAIALDSTGAVATANVVGTITISSSVVRVDLKTCGSSGTGDATNGDRFRVALTATLSSSGPLVFMTFINIDADAYDL